MEQVTVQFSLAPYGIQETVPITVDRIVNGVDATTMETFTPRNQVEVNAIEQIAGRFAASKVKNLPQIEQMIENRVNQINDPIGFYLKEAEKQAAAPDAPGLGTAIGEAFDILPGGDPFEPGKMGQGIKNFVTRALVTPDPKSTITDAGVIATDLALAGQLVNNVPNGKRNLQKAVLATLGKNKVAQAGAFIGSNVAAKYGGNMAYDFINDVTRYFMGLPDPSAAYEQDQTIRNLKDAYDEALFSGGAMGLQLIWPNVKRLLGKSLGINKDMKVTVGKDPTTGEPIETNLLQAADRANVPLNVFSASPSSVVRGATPVISIFPFVATKARTAQNIQQVAIAEEINNTLMNLSPYSLLAESSEFASDAFKKKILDFKASKATLYKRAMRLGEDVPAFIPTDRIKEQARILELDMYGPEGIGKGSALKTMQIRGPDLYTNLDEALKGMTAEADAAADALISIGYLKDTHMTSRQFDQLQKKLNIFRRRMNKVDIGLDGDQMQGFSGAMIETINDINAFKQFPDNPQAQVKANEFAAAYAIANKYFFKTKPITKGPTSKRMELADLNAAKGTTDVEPNMLTNQELTKILINDGTLLAPAAIKELKESIGDDGVKALARSVFDDKIRQTTKYVSGSVLGKTASEPTLFQQTKSFITGKEAESAQKSYQFNIPIIDVPKLREQFGVDDVNKTATMIEIFGKDQYERLRNVLGVADQVQQASFGDVSSFVKRRGFLGGINAITNLAFAGFVAGAPFQNVGLVLTARYGMSKLSDPKFMKGLTEVMNPELSDLYRRQALFVLGTQIFQDESDNQNIPPEVRENFDASNPVDVMKLLMFSSANDTAYPGNETMNIPVNDQGMVQDIELSKSSKQEQFSEDAQGVAQSLAEERNVTTEEPVNQGTPPTDPFLNVDFASLADTATRPTGGGSAPLTPDQRVALAGGDLDQAIAMGNRRA